MVMTQEEIMEPLYGTDEEISTNNEVLEEEEYVNESLTNQSTNSYKHNDNLEEFETFFNTSLISWLAESEEEYNFFESAVETHFIGFGEHISENLDKYQNIKTKYLKHTHTNYNGTTMQLIIQYQSNFLAESFNPPILDKLFESVFSKLKYKFYGLTLSPEIENDYVVPQSESVHLLCCGFNFFGENDTVGQILIAVPCNQFSEMLAVKELEDMNDILANLNKSCFEDEGIELDYFDDDKYPQFINDFHANKITTIDTDIKKFEALFDKDILWTLHHNDKLYNLVKGVSIKVFFGFGEFYKEKLESYPNITTKYLKEASIASWLIAKMPLIIHYQSNFSDELVNPLDFSNLFESIYRNIDFAYDKMAITSPKEIDFVPQNNLEPFLCCVFDFVDETSEEMGQILIALPYFGFLTWRDKYYLNQDETAKLLDAMEKE